MKLSPKVEEALNRQINREFASSYVYLSLAAWFHLKSLKGFAHWMEMQSKEELSHGMKLYDYLVKRAGKLKLSAIPTPQASWSTIIEAIEQVYNQEASTTEMINILIDVAQSEKDRATEIALHWFITEQVEEEDSANELLDKVRLAGNDPGAILLLDKELSSRMSE